MVWGQQTHPPIIPSFPPPPTMSPGMVNLYAIWLTCMVNLYVEFLFTATLL